jgi:hypothetical protein
MVLDKEDHRAILLQLIDGASFPGRFLRDALDLRDAVEAASVKKAEPSDELPLPQPSA